MTTRPVPVRRIAVILALVPAFATAARSSDSTPAEALIASRASSLRPVRVEGIGIKNFGVVDGRIFRGGQPEERDYEALARIGIKTVVDLRDDAEGYARDAARAAGLRYVNIALSDTRPPRDEDVASFLATVNDPENGLCYVHCAGGRHRTGWMIALYRLTADGWSPAQAYQEMLGYDHYSRWGHGAHRDVVFDYYGRMMANPAGVPVSYQPGSVTMASVPTTDGAADLLSR